MLWAMVASAGRTCEGTCAIYDRHAGLACPVKGTTPTNMTPVLGAISPLGTSAVDFCRYRGLTTVVRDHLWDSEVAFSNCRRASGDANLYVIARPVF